MADSVRSSTVGSMVFDTLRRVPRRVPGKHRLARWLTNHVSSWPTSLTDRLHFRYDVPDAREPVAFDLAIDGVYEPETLDCIVELMPRGGIFVDVGANVGCMTIPVAHHVGPTGCVVAVEASPRVFPFLARNVEASGMTHILCREAALVAAPGDVQFFPPPDSHFGMGSLAPQFHAQPVTVRGESLDSVLRDIGVGHVDVVKIDVEGFEVGVIQGAQNLLTGPRPPVVIFEFCDWAERRFPDGQVGDAQRLLKEWGFSIWRLEDFCLGRVPLDVALRSGAAMLVAARDRRLAWPGDQRRT